MGFSSLPAENKAVTRSSLRHRPLFFWVWKSETFGYPDSKTPADNAETVAKLATAQRQGPVFLDG